MVSVALTERDERIAYDRAGNGAPLVLLPGFQSWRLSWQQFGYVDALRDGFDIVCMDPLGHHESDHPHSARWYGCDRLVAHLDAVLEACAIDAAHVWGFSRGGMLAALYGRRRPERVLSVVMGAAPYGSCAVPLSHQMAVAEPALRAGDWATYWAHYPVPLPAELRARIERTNDPKASAAIIRASYLAPNEINDEDAATMAVPCFAYFGRGEVFADGLRDDLQRSGVPHHCGDWAGHAETMADAPGVISVVRPFLEATAS